MALDRSTGIIKHTRSQYIDSRGYTVDNVILKQEAAVTQLGYFAV